MDDLSGSERRVLVALVEVYFEAGRASVLDVADRAGYRSTSNSHKALKRLKERGLVTMGVPGALAPAPGLVVIDGEPFQARRL